jgi:anti-anti-sigma factor
MPEPAVHFHAAGLHVVVHGNSHTVTVSIGGEIDMAAANVLRTALHAAARTNAGPVIVDASAVTFVDGAGLQAMLAPLTSDRPAAMQIRNPSAPVRRLLTIIGRDDLLEPSQPSAPLGSVGPSERRHLQRPGHPRVESDQS